MGPGRRHPCIILGSGNIGTDLMAKLGRSETLELQAVVGIDPASEGLALARAAGVEASTGGVEWVAAQAAPGTIVFDATSATAHRENAPALAAAGLRSVDLTPAKLGPSVVPVVNLAGHLDAPDVNLITCGGQATIPIVAAAARVAPVSYAEIVSTVSSRSAGPGTRLNIDEFTRTTARGLEEIGGAGRGKAIIVLNPADPPILMRNTVFCEIADGADPDKVKDSIAEMVAQVAAYVPGYRMAVDPIVEVGVAGSLGAGAPEGSAMSRQAKSRVTVRVTVFLEVTGAGDYLPPYAGNLDIMTAAAVRVGEEIAHAGVPA